MTPYSPFSPSIFRLAPLYRQQLIVRKNALKKNLFFSLPAPIKPFPRSFSAYSPREVPGRGPANLRGSPQGQGDSRAGKGPTAPALAVRARPPSFHFLPSLLPPPSPIRMGRTCPCRAANSSSQAAHKQLTSSSPPSPIRMGRACPCRAANSSSPAAPPQLPRSSPPPAQSVWAGLAPAELPTAAHPQFPRSSLAPPPPAQSVWAGLAPAELPTAAHKQYSSSSSKSFCNTVITC